MSEMNIGSNLKNYCSNILFVNHRMIFFWSETKFYTVKIITPENGYESKTN